MGDAEQVAARAIQSLRRREISEGEEGGVAVPVGQVTGGGRPAVVLHNEVVVVESCWERNIGGQA